MTLKPIPQPPTYPLIGNLFDFDPEDGIKSICQHMQKYGPIVKFQVVGRTLITVGSQELVHEVCDQDRFEKTVQGALGEVRILAGDGLFTAHQDEESWAIAHRILIPAFGPLSIRNMFDGMVDIAEQLLHKWDRFQGQRIDVVKDFTKLTLDTIAFCTFSHRFNSFYSESPPPFVDAMFRALKESGMKMRRLPGVGFAYRQRDKQLAADVKFQHDMADELVQERIASKEDKGDLLDTMLKGRDPRTGKGLTPENIRYQLVTFLIAGHETTSGMLSFLFHFLLQTPSAVKAIREEVGRVCGSGPVEYQHLQKLEYVDAALKETLRLKSTAPAFSVTAKNEEEVLGGCYAVKRGEPIMIILDALHRDPAVWGNDAEEFKPERMLNGGFAKLPPDAWKPFGSGMRGCIGRPFAWQESLLVIAMIFQYFDIKPYNPDYELQIQTALTIKPANFYMYVTPRKDRKFRGVAAPSSTTAQAKNATSDERHGSKLYVYYGSNSGTCRALAKKMVATATARGMSVTLGQLNDVKDGLPTDGPVAICTASYEGQPTDDANLFYQWLSTAPENAASDVKYGVFGCGHPDWQSTFHAVPTKIDEKLSELGGTRIVERGKGNAAAAELFDEFDNWEESFLSAALPEGPKKEKAGLVAKIDKQQRQNTLQYESLQPVKVLSNEIITQGTRRIKRHISLELPPGETYRTGDYLALLPTAPRPFVMRALARFKLHPDDVVTLSGTGKSFTLPLNTGVSAFDLFSGFVELSQPVSLRQVKNLISFAGKAERGRLERYIQPEVFEKEIAEKRVSLLDLLEEFPSVDLPLGEFILALPPIRLRQYSISSSPLDDPSKATLTFSNLETEHQSGRGTIYYGTATTFLSNCLPGTYIRAGIRPSSAAFHPPLDPSTPILMACAGSGIAPFRGFIQERAIQKSSGRNVGPALLFFGCRSKDQDALYDQEMSEWEAQGVVSVRHAFSRDPDTSLGCKYVQDRIWHDRAETRELFKNGARVYICGSGALARGVKDTCAKIYAEYKGVDEKTAQEWMREVESERFATDVFA